MNKVYTSFGRPGLAALGIASLFIAAVATAGEAVADEFPENTINVVTHAGAGGGTDITTRMMMLRGRRALGQDMVVVNKRGGSGAAALNYLHSQPRDGYTIMTMTQSHIFQIVQGKVPVKIEDVVGLARATLDPQIVCVRDDSPIKSMADLVAASKAKDGGLKWGTTFAGGADHVAIHTLMKAAGEVPYTIVPFKGGGDIVTNLVGGNVDAALLNYAEGETQFNANELRPIAVMAKERIASLPDTPTTGEVGVDATAATIRGFVALKGIPEDRLGALEQGLLNAMKHSVFQGYLNTAGMPSASVVGREEWTAMIRQIHEDSKTALTELGMLK